MADKNKPVDVAVFNYLQQAGYENAANVLKKDLPTSTLEQHAGLRGIEALSGGASNVVSTGLGAIQQMAIGKATTSGKAREMMMGFKNIVGFVDSSLDMYRRELEPVLVPLWVHFLLALVKQSHSHAAGIFFEAWGSRFSSSQPQYVAGLRGLQHVSQIEGSPVASAFSTHQYTVALSSVTAQVLRSFLQDNKLFLALAILNQHVRFTLDLQTSIAPGDTNNGSALITPTDIVGSSCRSLRSGTNPKYRDPEMFPQLGHGDAVFAGAGMGSGMDPVSPTRLPWVCMQTIFNASSCSEVHAISMSRSSGIVVGGFGDSVVRVWDASGELDTNGKAISDNRDDEVGQEGERAVLSGIPLMHPIETGNGIKQRSGRVGPRSMEDIRNSSNAHIPRDRHENANQGFIQLVGHSKPVYSVDVDAGARHVISGSADGSVILWSLHTGEAVAEFVPAHRFPVWCVEFCPVGYYFLSGGAGRVAYLWARDFKVPLRVFAGHIEDVTCCSFHPNGAYAITGSDDRTVRVWETTTGKCVRVLIGHCYSISVVKASACGRFLASGDVKGGVRVWALASGKCVAVLKGHCQAAVHSLAWSNPPAEANTTSPPEILASGGADCTLRLWNVGEAMKTAAVSSGQSAGAPSKPKRVPANPGTATESCGPIRSFATRDTPVLHAHFTPGNVLMCAGGHATEGVPYAGPPITPIG